MTEYSNENRGQLWGNDKKETEKHPDFKGSLNIEGVEYWLSGWKRKPDANPKAPALSLSVQKKEDNRGFSNQPKRDDPFSDSGTDESIPF